MNQTLSTPLRAEPSTDPARLSILIIDAKGAALARAKDAQTADLIVQICNQHEKLLEAVRWYAEYGETTAMEYDCGKHAKAALAAGGETK